MRGVVKRRPPSSPAQQAAQIRRFMDRIATLEASHAELERRLENMVRHGVVTDVDPAKQVYRQEIGVDADGTQQKSPWIRYAQHAGGLKGHTPPVVGQTMTALSPSGDLEQAIGHVFGWNKANPAPGQAADHVWTYLDKINITMSDGKVVVTVPETTFKVDDDHAWTLDKNGMTHTGPVKARPDKNSPPKMIDSTHTHTGVTPGGGKTGIPS